MLVSIVIVSFNSEKYLGKCISSIRSNVTDIDYEIIVVDNASEDGSVGMVKSNYADVTLIENETNFGFAQAVNQGIKESKGEFILLLNPDTVFLNNAIKVFCEFLINNSEYACCGGALFNDDMEPVNSYGFFPSVRQVIFEELGLRKIFKKYYFKRLSPGCVLGKNVSAPFTVDYVSGADMFLRKSALNKVGFLNEDFFMYFEETELSFRLKKNNNKSALVPEAKIIHFEGKSLAGVTLEKFKLMIRSEFLFFKKCYGVTSCFTVKIILILGCVIKSVFTFDSLHLKKLKIIIKSN
jgi:GT2 family glycosyltransferase